MAHKIAILAGDGIGPEVMSEALKVLDIVSKKFNLTFEIKEAPIGGAAFDAVGNHFPEDTKKICEQSDAILFGSVGGPVSELHLEKWKNCEINSILGLRKAFDFNCNYRPIKIFNSLSKFCPLKKDLINNGVDILFIRELVGDIYFGEKKRFEKDGIRHASDVASYDENQISSVARLAFEVARKRARGKVSSVDKANVLAISKLWREIVVEVAKDYKDVKLEHILVDNCAMQLIKNPKQFDVVLTGNMFGDILTDEASQIAGSLGMLASASIGNEVGIFEPIHGSAPDIAGQNLANPLATILSTALMCNRGLNAPAAGQMIVEAVDKVLKAGYRTRDIIDKNTDPSKVLGTREMGQQVLETIHVIANEKIMA